MNQNKLHIDSVLKQILEKEITQEIPVYSEFLKKISISENSHILLDDALKSKLKDLDSEPLDLLEKTLAVLWLRRFRNAGIALLLVFGLGYGIQKSFITDIKQNDSINSPLSNNEKNSRVTTTSPILDNSLTDNQLKINLNTKHTKSNEIANKKEIISDEKIDGVWNAVLTDSNLKKEAKVNALEVNNGNAFQTLYCSPLNYIPMSVSIEPHTHVELKLKPQFPKKATNLKIPFNTGFTLSFNFTYSNQTYNTDLQNQTFSNTNKNYDALANNGKKNSSVFNYSISIEKNIFRNLSFLIGLSKISIKQKQQTDFILNEVPVFDIDGSISGYLSIPPEKISERLENQTTYFAMPFIALYNFQLNHNSSLQFRFGSSFMYKMKQNNQKFDYKSLDLSSYQNQSKKTSFNNFLYGCSYDYQIKTNYIISIGYERQNIFKVSSLSDERENVNTIINNITLAFKYKL